MGAKPSWTDQEWWDANVDQGALAKALHSHGILVLGWGNRKPICPKNTSYGEVTEIAQQVKAGVIKKRKRG